MMQYRVTETMFTNGNRIYELLTVMDIDYRWRWMTLNNMNKRFLVCNVLHSIGAISLYVSSNWNWWIRVVQLEVIHPIFVIYFYQILTDFQISFTSTLGKNFYQRVSIASYASAGIARGGMSVCPSVRLSVTLWYYITTKKGSVMISSPSESLNILVSRNISTITKFERGHPERDDLWDWGGCELAILAIFRPINHRISETVQDRTSVTINH